MLVRNTKGADKKLPAHFGIAMIVVGAAWWAPAANGAEPSTQPETQPSTQAATQPSTQPAKALVLDLGDKVTMKLALIPAGKFMMGSPDSEPDRTRVEGPQREVTLTKAFYMGIYPVTQEQYETVMGKNPSGFKGPQNPVESVSWDDAVAFCKRLSEKTGQNVRLPTEAEWEYACRAGSKTRFSFGDDETDLPDYAWYVGNSGKTTHPVGEKKPNAFGLYDMHGNVMAWCWDYYRNSYTKVKNIDPQGPADGQERVLRGGCWGHAAVFCRSAFRIGSGGRSSLYGFRVVVDVK